MIKLKNKIVSILLFLLCSSIVSCKKAENYFMSIDEFVQKYDLKNDFVYGNIDKDLFEIEFIKLPFLISGRENDQHNESQMEDIETFKIATYKFKNDENLIECIDIYGSQYITPFTLDFLINNLKKGINNSTSFYELSNEWNQDFSKNYIVSLDVPYNNGGFMSFNVSAFSYKDSSGVFHYLLTSNGDITPNITNDENRIKNIRFETTHKEGCPVVNFIPRIRTYLDKNTKFEFEGVAQGPRKPEAFYNGEYYLYEHSPIISNNIIGAYGGSLIELSFINPSSNEEPYKKYNSSPFNFLNLIHIRDLLGLNVKNLEVDYSIYTTLLKPNGSVIDPGNDDKTFVFNIPVNYI